LPAENTAVFKTIFSTIFGKIKQTPHLDVSFKIGTGFLGEEMQDSMAHRRLPFATTTFMIIVPTNHTTYTFMSC
jgi:hypothetical protein